MAGDAAEAEIDRLRQFGRERDRLQRRAEEVVGDADDAEGDADRHQHLRELAAVVDPPEKQALERNGDEDGAGDGEDDADGVSEAEVAGRIGRDVAADHGEGAMGQVDQPHQAHGQRQADADDEQRHAVGEGVEGDAQRGLHADAGLVGRERDRGEGTGCALAGACGRGGRAIWPAPGPSARGSAGSPC